MRTARRAERRYRNEPGMSVAPFRSRRPRGCSDRDRPADGSVAPTHPAVHQVWAACQTTPPMPGGRNRRSLRFPTIAWQGGQWGNHAVAAIPIASPGRGAAFPAAFLLLPRGPCRVPRAAPQPVRSPAKCGCWSSRCAAWTLPGRTRHCLPRRFLPHASPPVAPYPLQRILSLRHSSA